MSKEPNNIDRLIKKKLDGFEMTPPPGVWNSTASALGRNRKKGFILWSLLGLFILAIGAGVYFFSTTKSSDTLVAAKSSSIDNNSNANKANSKKMSQEDVNTASSSTDTALTNSIESSENSNDASNSQIISNSDQNTTVERGISNLTSTAGSNNSARAEQWNSTKDGNNNDGQSSNDQIASPASSKGTTSNPSGKNSADTNIKDQNDQNNQGNQTSNPKNQSNSVASSSNKKANDDSFGLPLGVNSSSAVYYSSLSTRPVRLLSNPKPAQIADPLKEDSLPAIIPFWKSLSVEAAFGISTFRNVPSKNTDSNLLSALNNTSSNQLSYDIRLGLNYHFTDRVSFQSGLHYSSSQENYAFKSENIETTSFVDTTSFSVDTMTMDTTFFIDTFYYDSITTVTNIGQNVYGIFTLPFQFSWSQPISPRGILEFSVGGAISIFGKNTGSVIVDNSNYSVDANQAYHTRGMLSMGGSVKYLHRFGNHHSVYVEPWAQFGITNQSKAPLSYESKRNRYGIRCGYRFYF